MISRLRFRLLASNNQGHSDVTPHGLNPDCRRGRCCPSYQCKDEKRVPTRSEYSTSACRAKRWAMPCISQHRAHRRSEKENPATAGGVVTGGVVWHPGVRCCCSNLARRELVPLALNLTSGDATYGDASRHNNGGHRSRRRPDGTLADIHSRSRGNRIRWLRPHGPTGTF